MPQAPDYPTIPVPTETPTALLASVNALKRGYEMLTGQDNAQSFAAHVFVQNDTPDALHVGDMWLCTLTTSLTFSVWNGSKWLKVGTVAMDFSADATEALLLGQFHNRRTV